MKHKTILYSILLIFSVFIYWLWRTDSPYPSVLNWDIFEHQTVVHQIRTGSWSLLPSHLTDTFRFDGYTTLFHTAIAGFQSIFPIDPLGWWWLAEGVHLTITVLVSCALAYAITKNTTTALLSGIIGATIFESQVAYSSLFLLPQTVSATLGVGAFIILFTEMSHRNKRVLMPLLVIASFLTHFIIGSYILGLLTLCWIAQKLSKIHTIQLGFSLALLIPTISYMITSAVNTDAINYGEAAAFSQPFTDKIRFLFQWYGGTIILIPIGIWMALRSDKQTVRILGVLVIAGLATILAPLPYALKFAVVGRYMVNIAVALPLTWIIQQLSTRKAKIVSLLTITIAFVVVFICNVQLWKTTLIQNGTVSELSAEEQNAATFLRQNGYNKNSNTLLLSDPATQYVLEAASGTNSQGGAYATRATRTIASAAISAQSMNELLSLLSNITDTVIKTKPTHILFIASGRYFRWLDQTGKQQNTAFNIWKPEALTLNDRQQISVWEQNISIKPIFTNSNMVIYDIPIQTSL